MGLIKAMVFTLWGYFTAGVLKVANGGTGIAAFGTGVATALGINVGTAGSVVTNGGTQTVINLVEQAAPAVSAAGQAEIYADSTSHITMISQNGGPYIPVAGPLEMTSLYTNYLQGNPIGAL